MSDNSLELLLTSFASIPVQPSKYVCGTNERAFCQTSVFISLNICGFLRDNVNRSENIAWNVGVASERCVFRNVEGNSVA